MTAQMSLQLVSGVDVMNIYNRPMIWEPDVTLPWSCLCEGAMVLTTAENLLDPTGVNCTTCLKPVPAGVNSECTCQTADCCCNCFLVTFPGITDFGCPCQDATDTPCTPNFPEAGAHQVTLQANTSIQGPSPCGPRRSAVSCDCQWDYIDTYQQIGLDFPCKGAATLGITFLNNPLTYGSISATYTCKNFTCKGGTFTFVSQSDTSDVCRPVSGPGEVWPTTVVVTAIGC